MSLSVIPAVVWVALGGAMGAVLRYLVVAMTEPVSGTFPAGTLLVNVLGCFAIGVLAGAWSFAPASAEWRLLLQTGLLGAFTTFSAFSLDTLLLWQAGHVKAALANTVLNVVICLAAVIAGTLTGGYFLRGSG